MEPAVRIRLLIENDRPALRRLFLDARRATFTWLDSQAFALDDLDVQTEGETILVADQTSDPLPLGFASWWPPENFLHHLYVAPGRTGQGIGTRLLHEALTRMARPARLKVMQPNIRARTFYEREGWAIESTGRSDDGPYFLMQHP